jgi:hypothetical protein
MWQKSILVRCLWVSTPVIQSVVIAAMLRRRLHRDFPWFFAYLAYAALSNLICIILFLTHQLNGKAIEYALFVQDLGCIILRFAIIYELFGILMRPYAVLRNTAHWVFRFAMAALLLGGVVLAASYHWAPNDSLILGSVNLGDRTVDVIQCGILLGLLLFSKYMRFSWRNYAFGIAIGLGIYASVDLSIASVLVNASTIPAQEGRLLALRLTVLSMSTYLFCNLMWFVYALLPERTPTMFNNFPDHDLDAWNHELERLLQR